MPPLSDADRRRGGAPPWGPDHAPKGLPPRGYRGAFPAIADHGGQARMMASAEQELRDAVDPHAPLTVEAILTEGTIDAPLA